MIQTSRWCRLWKCVFVLAMGALVVQGGRSSNAAANNDAVKQPEIQRGICAVLGLSDAKTDAIQRLLTDTELTVYFQSADMNEVEAVQRAGVDQLGRRLFVDRGSLERIHLADNLVDSIVVNNSAENMVNDQELLRVLHPGARATVGDRTLVKPRSEGTDSWSHPYHGPDNNPQSKDRLAKAPYLTQFLADPKFASMPEVSVAAGGRVFRAFGHIAHKANQNAMLNTLICVNGYNGTILWKRSLAEGFMIHRNTMIATPEILYLADHISCKLIDAATGKVLGEIVVPEGVSDGPVWKWMALADGVLYALVGAKETPISTQPSETPGLGHWPWGMWQGHDYSDPKSNFGYGRTFLAIDPKTKKVLWTHREDEFIDSRGVCMGKGRIYGYSPGKFMAAFDAKTGKPLWKNHDSKLLKAIGDNGRAQHYVTGYATTTYVKCHDDYLFFAGPQRSQFVAVSARDGYVLWQKEPGNLQLVLRDDGIYAAGPQQTGGQSPTMSYKFDYATGDVIAQLPMRRACTRATGSIDSVFYRASGGTVRIETSTNTAQHIAPMRPPCQDGVIISDGNLYWGPWMCGCQLSFYGHICLTSGASFNYRPGVDSSRLQDVADNLSVQDLPIRSNDWPAYQGDNQRSCRSSGKLSDHVTRAWSHRVSHDAFPTAPVTAGGLVFIADRTGAVNALDASTGAVQWTARTNGAIYFPPAIDQGRLFVGSADGRVYAFEAATGRPLWTFRVAPVERWIPVYGTLISTWPVAGGVVVQDGVVYAAAGIAHYDGTHVVALDAKTGSVRWYNDTSGTISTKANHGVSLQGSLAIRNGELRFLGGGVHEEARYDLKTGNCLNAPNDAPRSTFHTAFYPYFPDYGNCVSLNYDLADGRTLSYDVTYEGSWTGALTLLPALPDGARRPYKPISRWGIQRRRGQQQKAVWRHDATRRFNAFVVTPTVLLAAGYTGKKADHASFLGTVTIEDGKPIWVERLDGSVVKGGVAVNDARQIFVSLEDGRLLAFNAVE